MLALATVCLWTGNNARAQVVTEIRPVNSRNVSGLLQRKNMPDMQKYDVQRNGSHTTYYPKQTRQLTQTRSGESVKVTFDVKFDDTKYMLAMLNIFNKRGEAMIRWYSDVEENALTVPADVYDICCVLLPSIDPFANDEPETIWLFKENVELAKDVTVTFDAADATNIIEVGLYNKDGQPATPPSLNTDTGEEISPGNVTGIYCWSSILPKEYCGDGLMYTYSGSHDMNFNNHVSRQFNVRTNDVSDRFAFVFTRVTVDKNNDILVNRFEQQGSSGNATLKNNPDNYVCYTEDFVPTPAGKKSGFYGMPGLDLTIMCNNKEMGGMYFIPFRPDMESTGRVSLYIDAPKTADAAEKGYSYDLMAAPMFGDERHEIVEEWPMEDGTVQRNVTYAYSYIYGLPVFTDGDNTEYVRTPNYAFRKPEGGGDAVMYPGHGAFSFTSAQRGMSYGASAPINNFEMTSFYSDKMNATMFYYYPNYIGQMGEQRETDLGTTQAVLKFNNEEVYNDKYYGLGEFTFNWAMSSPAKGVFDLTLTNTNVEVDGLKGKNVTRVVYDEQKADAMAPVLQMLQLRNSDGLVTNRFDTPADGTLQLAGGDFAYKENKENNTNWYECQEQTIEVAYSPYGQDSWENLPVAEIPELYSMPGFGYFYRGTLESVSRESANGWYDLKITLTDASGNKQEQTVSPAFNIKSTTGLAEVMQTDIDVRHENGQLRVTGTDKAGIALYSVDGVCVMRTADAVARPVSTGNIPSGLYMVRVTADDGQMITKKITVR